MDGPGCSLKWHCQSSFSSFLSPVLALGHRGHDHWTPVGLGGPFILVLIIVAFLCEKPGVHAAVDGGGGRRLLLVPRILLERHLLADPDGGGRAVHGQRLDVLRVNAVLVVVVRRHRVVRREPAVPAVVHGRRHRRRPALPAGHGRAARGHVGVLPAAAAPSAAGGHVPRGTGRGLRHRSVVRRHPLVGVLVLRGACTSAICNLNNTICLLLRCQVIGKK